MNDNVIGIGHVAYTTGQMDAMMRFYCEILGFENAFALFDKDNNPWIHYIRVAGCQFIELFYAKAGEEPKFREHGSTYAHLCIQVADIQAMSQRLKANGIDVYWGPVQGLDKNWQCWACDPDGNPIEFMQIDPASPQARAAGIGV